MSVLESLSRKVGHEINNQLTGAFGYLSLAQNKLKTPSKISTYLDRIHTCCETSQKLINHMFLFGEKPGQTKLTYLIEEANEVAQQLFKTENRFEHKIHLNSESIVLPYAGFKVLLHFYLQLIQRSTDEGSVIHTRVNDSEESENDDEAVRITLEIYGEASRAAQPSTPTDQPVNPSFCESMCIMAAQKLVELWGGKTELNHENNQKPYVKLTLPAAALNSVISRVEHQRRNSAAANDSAPKILLLEDQEAISSFIREMLQEEGFESVVFKSGHQLDSALTRLDLDSFQLFLLDIFVPGSSGLELAMRIRQRKPDAKLLFYSALTNLDTVEKLFPLGPTTIFMPKPFKKEELISNIHEMLEVESV